MPRRRKRRGEPKKPKKNTPVWVWKWLIRKRRREGKFKFSNSRHAYMYMKKAVLRPHSMKKQSMFLKFNKLYKEINYKRGYLNMEDAYEVLRDDNRYFHGLKVLRRDGAIREFKTRRRIYFRVEDIEQEMLMREVCCYKDDLLFQKEERAHDRKKYIDYLHRTEPVYVHINGEKKYLGEYPAIRMKDVEEAVNFLLKYKDIFSRSESGKVHPCYMSKFVTRRMNKNLDDSKIEKFIKTYKNK